MKFKLSVLSFAVSMAFAGSALAQSTADALQSGSGNTIDVVQSDSPLAVIGIGQVGTGNKATASQLSAGNSAMSISQDGANNTATADQADSDADANIFQSGSGNNAKIGQTNGTNGSTATVNQFGASQTATIIPGCRTDQ